MLRQERIILIVSILTGIVAFMLILNYLSHVAQPKHSYVVASVLIPKGRIITSDNLTMSGPMPIQSGKDNLFFQIQDVVGYVAKEDIPKGSKIRRTKVLKQESTAQEERTDPLSMVYPIPPGMGGVMIQANQLTDMPSQIVPGKYVNIMGFISDYRGQSQQITLIYSCMITMVEKPGDSIKAIQVALTPQESEVLIAALSRGKLRLVLLQEKEGKPLFLPSFGQIEIIRGTNEQRSSTYGGRHSTQRERSNEEVAVQKSQPPSGGLQGPLATIGKVVQGTMNNTAESAATV